MAPHPSVEPELVSVWPDAGEALGVGQTTVKRLVRTGELESVVIGRRRLVPVSAIREYVARLRTTQGAAS